MTKNININYVNNVIKIYLMIPLIVNLRMYVEKFMQIHLIIIKIMNNLKMAVKLVINLILNILKSMNASIFHINEKLKINIFNFKILLKITNLFQ